MAVPWVKQARSLGITARHSLGLSCIPALGLTPSTRTRVPAIERNKGNQWAGEVSSRPSERRNRGVNISWGPLHSRSSRPQHSPNHAKDF